MSDEMSDSQRRPIVSSRRSTRSPEPWREHEPLLTGVALDRFRASMAGTFAAAEKRIAAREDQYLGSDLDKEYLRTVLTPHKRREDTDE